MSSLLVGDDLSHVQRWEMPLIQNFDVPQSPPQSQVPRSTQHLDELEKAAYEDGFARGHADGHLRGLAEGAQKVREQAERLSAVFDHLARPLRDLDADVERLLVALAIEVGGRLAQQALRADPDLVIGIIREALGTLSPPSRDAEIHLHPSDVDTLADTLSIGGETAAWHLVPDATLGRGDCRIVTDSARVDGRLDTRVAGIAQALLGERA